MKIIYGIAHSEIPAHARKVIRALDAEDERHPNRYTKPRGIPRHLAKFPVTCDECGETFWANDEYASHARCKGGDKPRVGFA